LLVVTVLLSPLFYLGYDKEGHPLLIWRSSRHEAAERDMSEMVRLITWWFQHMAHNMPEDKSKITLLCDRSDYKSSNSDIEFVKVAASVLQVFITNTIIPFYLLHLLTPVFIPQNNFPERLHRAIIYPTGLVFYGLWNVVKWFLDPVTQSKAAPVIYASGVQYYIDPEHIPAHLGGTDAYEFDHGHFDDPVHVLAADAAAAAALADGIEDLKVSAEAEGSSTDA
jgi:hypothetical protein